MDRETFHRIINEFGLIDSTIEKSANQIEEDGFPETVIGAFGDIVTTAAKGHVAIGKEGYDTRGNVALDYCEKVAALCIRLMLGIQIGKTDYSMVRIGTKEEYESMKDISRLQAPRKVTITMNDTADWNKTGIQNSEALAAMFDNGKVVVGADYSSDEKDRTVCTITDVDGSIIEPVTHKESPDCNCAICQANKDMSKPYDPVRQAIIVNKKKDEE
jgi:hypothetical protein